MHFFHLMNAHEIHVHTDRSGSSIKLSDKVIATFKETRSESVNKSSP